MPTSSLASTPARKGPGSSLLLLGLVVGLCLAAPAAATDASVATAEPGCDSGQPCSNHWPPFGQVSIILSAFGDASGGESQPFLQALTHKINRSREATYCGAVWEGTISRQPVVVVTTGTGSDNSGPCMQELLYWYGPRIREVIWAGIGGASPAIGGIVEPGSGKLRTNPRPVMIGDVCVGNMAWDYDLHFSAVDDWRRSAEASGNLNDPQGGWWDMKDSSGGGVIGFEGVQQYVIAPRGLADEILSAAAAVRWDRPSGDALDNVKRYFSDAQIRETMAFDYTVCGGEVSGNNFFHGAVEDRLSRQYLAGLINSAKVTVVPVTENDVVAFSAMESTAWMSVVDRWAKKRRMRIPMAVVRGASNYDHQPLLANGRPAPDSTGHIPTAMEDILLGFKESGSSFAAANAAAPVLKMFARR